MKTLLLFFALITLFCSAQEVPTWLCEQPQQKTATDTVIYASGAIVPSFTTAPNGTTYIKWNFLTPSSSHKTIYFDSAIAQPNGNIRVYFPQVKEVSSFLATGDDILSKYATVGYSIATTYAELFVGTPAANAGELRGNNTALWTKSERISLWDVTRDTGTGLTRLNVITPQLLTTTTADYQSLTITYTGTNNRLIKRVYSGTGTYNVGFYLTDLQGNIIKGNSDPNDRVVVSCGMTNINVNCYRVGTNGYELNFFKPQSAIIMIGVFTK